MATLVSPGVSVTVTDQSYFVPASAPTVPLIVLATRENKPVDPTNPSSAIAPGTEEYGVVRTITSLAQSQATFGIPYFNTTNGQPNHGDATNEYGLAALNKFLGNGSFAYTIRANVNLDTNFADLQSAWISDIEVASSVLENLVAQWIAQYNTNYQLSPSDPSTAAAFTISYTPALTLATAITKPSAAYTATVTVDGTAIPVSIDLSTTPTVASFLAALNTALGVYGSAALSPAGNIVISSTTVGSSSTVIAVDTNSPTNLFGNIAVGASIPGVQATGTNGYAVTIDTTSLYALIVQATAFIWQNYSFGIPTTPTTLQQDFMNNQTALPFPVYANGFTSPQTGTFIGISGLLALWLSSLEGSVVPGQLTPSEAGNLLTEAGDQFEWTNNFLFKTSLGPDDASRRAAIVQALTAIVNSNQDIRAETIEYNLILCPGYPELASPMDALVVNYLNSEVLVIGDTPMNVDLSGTSFGSTSGPVFAVTIANGGTGYGNGTYYNVPLTGGAGSGAFATISVVAGAVTTVTIVNGGSAYVVGNILTASNTYLGGAGVNFSCSVATVEQTGSGSLQDWAASSARVIDVAGNVCYYYPHILTTNLDGATILVPSSAQALATMAYSDNISYEWFAPAGVTRGIITGITDIGYCTGTLGQATTFVSLHPNQGQRDVMYAYTAQGGINPLVYFPGNGFLVWGQKTSTGTTASALDRVNVSRLVKYIARSLRKSALAFVFEPNDTLTQNNLKTMVDSFLGNLVTQRGLYDFASVCDSSNNTPAVVDSNSLIIDVAIKPVKAAEFIYIPITIVATGASLNTSGASQSV